MPVPVTYKIRDRGPTPRGMRTAFNASSKASWYEAGVHYHTEMTDRRFTNRHASLAGFEPRKRTYEFRKFKEQGHTRPLEYSGESRRQVKAAAISSTSKGARVRYAGARKFNFRHPESSINMAEEFTRVLPSEADELAQVYDRDLDQRLNQFTA